MSERLDGIQTGPFFMARRISVQYFYLGQRFTWTSATLDRDRNKEKWIPTAGCIRPFEYNGWEGWDGKSGLCTTEGSLGGYGNGDEGGRIGPRRFSLAESRGIGTRTPGERPSPRLKVLSTTPRPLYCHPIYKLRGKGKLNAQQAREGWRVRWKQVSSVPTFRSPLAKILSPIVARAQWEVVTGLGILAFVISSVIVGVLIAMPVP